MKMSRLAYSKRGTRVSRPTNRNMLDWALRYAARGWHVFPVYEPTSPGVCSCPKGNACERVGKHPRTPHGLSEATVDRSTITEWWTRWPNANIGVATGKISGIIVLDQDGPLGPAFLHGRLLVGDPQGFPRTFPATLYSITGRFLGIHYVYKYPDDDAEVPSSTGRVGPNLDVRGDGGCFIAPPSAHELGKIYRWQNDLEPADAPEWLLRRARSRTLSAPEEGPHGLPQQFLEGQRNSSLTSLGGDMRARGFSVSAILAALEVENQERCVPPLPAYEVAGIAESLGRYPPAAPVVLPQLPALQFRSAREVADMTPARVPWVARPWLVEACVTEVDGKIKEAGKTTWLTILGRALLDGRDFLGYPTTKSPVVYLTEQSNTSFREALRRADLLDREDFMILSLHETMRMDFRTVMGAAVRKALEIGAKVIVVDTLARWARLRGDMENSAGEGAEAVRPLKEAAANHGLAIIFARHERKAGGPVGDAARGSSAIGGEVDIILSLRRPAGHDRTVRQILSLSRFDETPENLLIELRPEGYVALGNPVVAERDEAVEDLLRILPLTEEGAITINEIKLRTGRSRSDLQRVLALLQRAGRVVHSPGRGRSPARYWQVEADAPGDFEGPDDTDDA